MKELMSLALLVWAAQTSAAGLATVAQVRKLTDEVMDKVAQGDLEGGFTTFKALTIIPPAEFDAMVGQAVTQVPLITARFGATLGQEFIKEVRVGESLAELIYIHRFERHAMRWQFYLYRGKDGWVINTFRFDDRWPELLDNRP